MDDTVIAKMRARVAQGRQLANSISNPRAAKILRQMADEGEADIKCRRISSARWRRAPATPARSACSATGSSVGGRNSGADNSAVATQRLRRKRGKRVVSRNVDSRPAIAPLD